MHTHNYDFSYYDNIVNSMVTQYQALPLHKLQCHQRKESSMISKQTNWFVQALHNQLSTHYLKKILHACIRTLLSYGNTPKQAVDNLIVYINDRLGLL